MHTSPQNSSLPPPSGEPSLDGGATLFTKGEPRPTFDREDLLRVFCLALWTAALSLFGLSSLEFLRHTEADRTLIAWEMVERGQYLVPHLLGSVILTKPPLFYWLIAASIHLFGEASEAAARFPSAAAAILFVTLQYIILRSLGATRSFATLSAIVLSSGVLFFTLAEVAEIDMVFGFLCGLTFYASFFSNIKRSNLSIIVAYLIAALSFLTKGPPVVFFFAASQGLFFLWYQFFSESGRTQKVPASEFILRNVIGILVFLTAVLGWLHSLAQVVGWSALRRQWQVEILERVFHPSSRGHSSLFYFFSLFQGAAPWSLFAVAAVLMLFSPETRRKLTAVRSRPKDWEFLVFNLLVVGVSILMLSLAEGKTSRYLFPVYALVSNLIVFCMLLIRNTKIERTLFYLGMLAAPLALLSLSSAPFFLNIDGVSIQNIIYSGIALAAPFVALWVACFRRSRGGVVLAILLVMSGIRVGEKLVYAPHRNLTKSVKPLALEIDSLLKPSESLYTVEMFERWVVFYLKHLGRDTLRLNPELIAKLDALPQRVPILLNKEEESWRVQQLRAFDPTLKVIKEFNDAPDPVLLIEVSREALTHLDPHEEFPTTPSRPFYSGISLGLQ